MSCNDFRATTPARFPAVSAAVPPVATLLAAVLLISACGGQRGPEKAAVVSTQIDIVSVNEVLAPATATQLAVLNFALFMPLLEEQADYQNGPPSFQPRIAES